MKLSWGRKLVIGAILFMAFIVSMIVIIMKQDVPLVETNYYEVGLNYQKQMEMQAGADSLIDLLIVEQNKSHCIVVQKKIKGNSAHGMLFFSKPSDTKQDFKQEFHIEKGDSLSTAIQINISGEWNINTVWQDENGEHKYKKHIHL